MSRKCIIILSVLLTLRFEFVSPLAFSQSPAADFAYGENIGWINLAPSQGGGVNISPSGLTGYAWGENVGWISFSCINTNSCAITEYGVQNDGSGNLSGYAWGENIGWISFSCANTTSCGTSDYMVRVDGTTGKLTGKAWAKNVGWISFDPLSQPDCIRPTRPAVGAITQGFGNTPSWSRGAPHNGTDYSSPLQNPIRSIGPNGVVHQYTKPDARWFGSIDPGGDGPAIWVKHTLKNGEPIYVLYGHTATSWMDNSTGSGRTFQFGASYTVQWARNDLINSNTRVGRTAPFYNGGFPQPHLHISIFKPKKVCQNSRSFCGPPASGWGYSEINLSTGDFIDPEQFFSDPQYCLAE